MDLHGTFDRGGFGGVLAPQMAWTQEARTALLGVAEVVTAAREAAWAVAVIGAKGCMRYRACMRDPLHAKRRARFRLESQSSTSLHTREGIEWLCSTRCRGCVHTATDRRGCTVAVIGKMALMGMRPAAPARASRRAAGMFLLRVLVAPLAIRPAVD